MLIADYLAEQLLAADINDVFAIPGDFILPWLERFEQQSKLKLIQLSHEPAAVFAADAAARFTNRPSAVALTYGAGALNATNAIAQAFMEFVPMIVFAGFPSKREIESGYLLHHQIGDVDGQRRILAEITAKQVRFDDASTIELLWQDVLATCLQERRPVLIELPRDYAVENFSPKNLKIQESLKARPKQLPHELTESLSVLLNSAKAPCCLVGAKARRFGFDQAISHFSLSSNAPCAATLLGRSVLNPSACCYVGVFSGTGQDPLLPFLQESDLLLVCGVIKSDSNFAGNPALLRNKKVLWWDENGILLPNGKYYQIEPAAVAAWLADFNIRYEPRSAPNSWVQDLDVEDKLAETCWSSGTAMKLLHQELSAQSELFPFVLDIGDCLFASLYTEPRWLLAPAFYASMGYAVPAALGLQQVSKKRPIVIVGDGAFQMTGLELGHCQRYGWNPIVIVLNNQSWGMIKAFAPELSATSLSGWNYAALARAMNGGARQVWNGNQFVSAIADAIADDGRFRLIEVMLPKDSFSDCLAKFSGAMRGESMVDGSVV